MKTYFSENILQIVIIKRIKENILFFFRPPLHIEYLRYCSYVSSS